MQIFGKSCEPEKVLTISYIELQYVYMYIFSRGACIRCRSAFRYFYFNRFCAIQIYIWDCNRHKKCKFLQFISGINEKSAYQPVWRLLLSSGSWMSQIWVAGSFFWSSLPKRSWHFQAFGAFTRSLGIKLYI